MGIDAMTPETVRVFALVVAAQARIEGMKAANAVIDPIAYPLRYDENAFFNEAAYIEQLSIQVINQ